MNGNFHDQSSKTTFGDRETTRLIAKVAAFNVGTQCPESAEDKVRPTFERVLTVKKRAGLPDTLQGKLQQLSKEIQEFRTQIWTIEARRDDNPSWFGLTNNEREKLLTELEKAQKGLATTQETFWDLNVPGDPAQRAKERQAEATRWIRFKAERNEARARAEWIRLEREARVNLAAREQELLDDENKRALSWRREPPFKRESHHRAHSSRSVSSRLGTVKQTDKSGSARGTASPAPLTNPGKPKRVGSEKRRRIEKQSARDPIGTPGRTRTELSSVAEEWPELQLKTRARAKADADTQVEARSVRSVTPENWEEVIELKPRWDRLVVEDNFIEE